MKEISAAIDNKMSTIGVFIDLKKAFDTINHNILIDKLEHYGVRGTANKWIMNYLNGRQQYVQIDNVHSGFEKVIHGIPQGSILGPRLFIATIILCYFELRRLASIRRFLTSTATATLVSAFVLLRIDYCNSLLFGSTHNNNNNNNGYF